MVYYDIFWEIPNFWTHPYQKAGIENKHPSSHSWDSGHNLISAHTAQLNFQGLERP